MASVSKVRANCTTTKNTSFERPSATLIRCTLSNNFTAPQVKPQASHSRKFHWLMPLSEQTPDLELSVSTTSVTQEYIRYTS